MTANERFEKAWGSFLVYLNRNPKAQLTPFLKERHINHRTMMNWMCEKGYSVLRAKQEIRQAQEAARREKAEASTSSTGMMFVPMEPPTIDLPMEDLLYSLIKVYLCNDYSLIKNKEHEKDTTRQNMHERYQQDMHHDPR